MKSRGRGSASTGLRIPWRTPPSAACTPAHGSIWKSIWWRATFSALLSVEDKLLSFHEIVSPPETIIEEARNGRLVILVDDEGREDEGDLIIPAQMATPQAINFMARYGRGLVCLALTRERVARAGLAL